jgi:hypothetical protein
MTPTEIVDNIAPTALHDIAADETPEQQEWAAVLLEACALIMRKCGYEGKMALNADQIMMNADGCRAWAEELRKREAERLLNLKPMEVPPNPFKTGKVNTDENGFPTI